MHLNRTDLCVESVNEWIKFEWTQMKSDRIIFSSSKSNYRAYSVYAAHPLSRSKYFKKGMSNIHLFRGHIYKHNQIVFGRNFKTILVNPNVFNKCTFIKYHIFVVFGGNRCMYSICPMLNLSIRIVFLL